LDAVNNSDGSKITGLDSFKNYLMKVLRLDLAMIELF